MDRGTWWATVIEIAVGHDRATNTLTFGKIRKAPKFSLYVYYLFGFGVQ